MLKTKTMIIATFITATALGTFALAHNKGENSNFDHSQHMQNSMKGGAMMHHMMASGMGNGMYMGFSQPMFDTAELTQTLSLNNEQISILSQLEASHLMMQELMKSSYQSADGEIDHEKMMSSMTENMTLMSEHHALYQQFTDSLSESQQALWQENNIHCH